MTPGQRIKPAPLVSLDPTRGALLSVARHCHREEGLPLTESLSPCAVRIGNHGPIALSNVSRTVTSISVERTGHRA